MREKNKLIQYALLLLLLLIIFSKLSSAVSSQSMVMKNSLFIRFGSSYLEENSLKGRGLFSAGGVLYISKNIGLEFEGRVDLLRNEYDSRSGLQSLWNGDLSLIGANVSVLYSAPLSKKMGLYFLTGIGYSINNFTIQEEYGTTGFQIEETIDNSISFHAGGGLDIAVFKWIAVNMDIRYSLSKAGGIWSVRDTLGTASISNTTETDLNRVLFMLGIKFFL